MYSDQTIFAPATAPQKSGVAIIRISGPDSAIAYEHLTKKKLPPARLATISKLIDPETSSLIDEALCIWFPSPHSFTGENILEIHIHGSIAVINIIMRILSNLSGFRIANPGEFSQRAFENGKMDLTEAEGLADLINSETISQQKQAIRQMSGELGNLYEKWRKELIHILAYIEAYIDFPDEDIPSSVIDEITSDLASLKLSIMDHLNDNNRGEKLRSGLYAVIIGEPNVGKSTLINFLAKREVAIVSNIAGTTRDIIELHLDINGYPLIIADTAGICQTDDHIEKEGIRRAYDRAKLADIKIIMLDATKSINQIDQEIIELMDDHSIILVNKIDSLSNADIYKKYLCVSLTEKINCNAIFNILEDKIKDIIRPSSFPIITRERYRVLLRRCLEHLEIFSFNKPIELAAEDIRLAARSLGEITGKIDIDLILDEIFSNFCIGK